MRSFEHRRTHIGDRRMTSDECRHGAWHRKLLYRGESTHLVYRRLRIPDYSRGAQQDIAHPHTMTALLSRPAIFGMGERDQIVDQEYRSDPGFSNPLNQGRVI